MLTTVTQAPAIPVDELDLRLIAQLETNPRESNLHLARDLGVSPSTVSRKLRRLLDE
ncbi:MAG: AsnC family protein, partial [Chloroflexi bacterium]|nr:AsnC family protein [Chloroflexota bacterium]